MPKGDKKPLKSEKGQQIRLSIIIPYYNAEPYTSELLDRLLYQMRDDVEVIVIDDGSRIPFKTELDFVKVIRQENHGVGFARNVGIDKAKGEYISFIDADDLVSEAFIDRVLEKTKDEPDIIELSWKSLTTKMWNITQKLNSDQDRLPNPSVCTRVFKRSFIGDVRFNTKKDSTEDEDFARRCGYHIPLGDTEPLRANKTVCITDFMYFYRDDVPMSKTKKYAKGLMNTKRVVYYYKHVTADMTWLLEEIKEEDEVNEVFLQTNQCDIPELKRYCTVEKPHSAWGHFVRGEKCDHIEKREPPLKAQIVIYRRHINKVGGLITFMNNFIDSFGSEYDIIIACENIEEQRRQQLSKKVRVAAGNKPIICDNLIVLSFLDHMPGHITAEKTIRMCHACRTDKSWHIPEDYDELIYVSRTAMESFGVTDGQVLHNIIHKKTKDTLLLMSATRLPAEDKGDIENRMRTLANMLNAAEIPFLWLNFSDGKLPNPPKNFYNVGVTHDMQSYMSKATYVVSLSDSECWSYTVLESLMAGTPLICTPFPSAFEMGIKDGVNAHVVPFDMNFDVRTLLEVPQFDFEYDNEQIIKEWKKIFGKPKPKPIKKPEKIVMTKVIGDYHDVQLDADMKRGQHIQMTLSRAREVESAGFIKIIRGD